ncbi:MAG: hypothetical protein IPG45_29840 [Deltaproteobacteria bacterium]|nr:hypothetical protein [Deltaproteobacteria bacterium]
MNLISGPGGRSAKATGIMEAPGAADPSEVQGPGQVQGSVDGPLPETGPSPRSSPRKARRWLSVVGGSVAALAVMLGAVGGSSAVSSAELGQSAGRALSTPMVVVDTTVPNDPTQLSATISRNGKVEAVLIEAESDARRGVASTVTFLPSKGTKFQSWYFGYKTGEPRRMNILELPEGGIVRGTIVVNPSGHTGKADEYARSNTYTVHVTLPDGVTMVREGHPRNVVIQGLPFSTAEYATAIDVEFPYRSGITRLWAAPGGSAGIDGYVEGRLYLVHSHDQKWSVTAAWGASVRHLFDSDSHGPIPFPVPYYRGR